MRCFSRAPRTAFELIERWDGKWECEREWAMADDLELYDSVFLFAISMCVRRIRMPLRRILPLREAVHALFTMIIQIDVCMTFAQQDKLRNRSIFWVLI